MRNYSGKEDLYPFPRSQDGAFALEMMGTSYCDGNYYIRRRNSQTWVFEYIIKGKGTLRIDDRTVYPAAGQTYIIPAFTNHEYYSDADDPWEKRWFNTGGPLVPSLISSYGITDRTLVEIPGLREIFDRAYYRNLDEPLLAHQTTALAIHEIIATIAHMQPKQESKRTQKLHDYLITHLDEMITADEMAEVASLSVSQTIRLFKKEWLATPYQFHLNCRIDAAKTLLRSSSAPIREISDSIGFSDEYHFAGTFKKKTGISPGRFRSFG